MDRGGSKGKCVPPLDGVPVVLVLVCDNSAKVHMHPVWIPPTPTLLCKDCCASSICHHSPADRAPALIESTQSL